MAVAPREAVFLARGLSKVYRMGEVAVHALRSVDLELYEGEFVNLIPSLTTLENVELVTEIAERPMPADEALLLVGLGERLHHFPAQLSGGEQQRVAIARAIAKRPDALLCEEPTGALDFATGKLALEVLEQVNQELGTTTAVITHNAAIAAMADRVIRLGSGEIVEVRRNETKARPVDLEW